MNRQFLVVDPFWGGIKDTDFTSPFCCLNVLKYKKPDFGFVVECMIFFISVFLKTI